MNDRLERIRTSLEQALHPLELQVDDESHLHAGHEGARDGRGHFRVQIVAAEFAGQPLIRRHQRDVCDRLSTQHREQRQQDARARAQVLRLRDEFEAMRGLKVLWTVTDDPESSLLHERIDAKFLKAHVGKFDQNFYLCGPDPMVKELRGILTNLGANVENVTWEK